VRSTRDSTVRHGTIRWLNDPPNGIARLHVDSNAFTTLPLSIRGGEPNDLATSPGELLAAAYSAFIATNLAERLERHGVPARELVVDVWCRLSREVTARSVEGVDIEIRGRVPRLDEQGFEDAARATLERTREALGLRADLDTKLGAMLAP